MLKRVSQLVQLKLKEYPIQKENLLFALDKACVIFSFLTLLTASYIANYNTEINTAWIRFSNLLYFDFLLVFFALRRSAKIIIGNTFYKIIVYLLINNFFDKAIGLEGWSWNDFLTVLIVTVEYVVSIKRSK